MDILEKIDMMLGEGESDGKSFPAKKKKDDADSETRAEDKTGGADGKEDPDEEDPFDPETDLDKEKKQKQLKKNVHNTPYVPPYA